MNAHQQAAFDQWFAVESARQDLESFSSQSNMQMAYAQALASQSDTLRALVEALKRIEAHHVEQNRLKGRDESKSFTLTQVRAALSLAAELGIE